RGDLPPVPHRSRAGSGDPAGRPRGPGRRRRTAQRGGARLCPVHELAARCGRVPGPSGPGPAPGRQGLCVHGPEVRLGPCHGGPGGEERVHRKDAPEPVARGRREAGRASTPYFRGGGPLRWRRFLRFRHLFGTLSVHPYPRCFMAVTNPPPGYHSVTPYLIVTDSATAIDFYQKAF